MLCTYKTEKNPPPHFYSSDTPEIRLVLLRVECLYHGSAIPIFLDPSLSLILDSVILFGTNLETNTKIYAIKFYLHINH